MVYTHVHQLLLYVHQVQYLYMIMSHNHSLRDVFSKLCLVNHTVWFQYYASFTAVLDTLDSNELHATVSKYEHIHVEYVYCVSVDVVYAMLLPLI
jgi:hypothetical protein